MSEPAKELDLFEDDAAPAVAEDVAAKAAQAEAAAAEPEGDADAEKPAEGEPERVTFTPEQQAKFNEVIGEKARKAREAEEKARALEAELAEARAKLPQAQRPDIPPPPDPYDDDFAGKVAARDKAIAEAAAFDAAQAERDRQAQVAQIRQQQAAQAAIAETVQTYDKRRETLGIAPDALKAAAQVVQAHGMSDDVARFVLEHEAGPAVTVYLAENPMVMDAVSRLSPMQAAAYIATEVAGPAAAALKGGTPPPDPVEPVRGGAAPDLTKTADGTSFRLE